MENETRSKTIQKTIKASCAAWLRPLCTVLIVFTLLNPLFVCAAERVGSTDELVAYILSSWQKSVKAAEANRQQPDWKQSSLPRAILLNLSFRGSNFIAALAHEDLAIVEAIEVIDCEISGGLNFQLLPEIPLNSLVLPSQWSTNQRESWLAQSRAEGFTGAHVVRPSLSFRRTKFSWSRGQFLTFSAPRTLFQGSLELREVTIGQNFSYGEKSFHNAVFAGDLVLDKVTWSETWDMAEAVLSDSLDLANLDGDLMLKGAHVLGQTRFSDLSSKLDLSDTVFEQTTIFEGNMGLLSDQGQQSGGGMSLARAHFKGPLKLEGTIFHDMVDMSESIFEGLASFRASRFLDSLKLEAIDTGGLLDFRDAEFHELDFRNPGLNLIEARVDFRGAKIHQLYLENIVFASDVDFSDAELGNEVLVEPEWPVEQPPSVNASSTTALDVRPGLTNIRFVTFEGRAYFLRTIFHGDVLLGDIIFKETVDFTEALFLTDGAAQFMFSFVRFSDLIIHWSQLPPTSLWVNNANQAGTSSSIDFRIEPLSDALAKLEMSFRLSGRLADANHAYLMVRLTNLAEARRTKTLWNRLESEVEWLLWGLPTGYGTNILQVLALSVTLCILFSLLLMRGQLHRRPFPEAEREFNLRLRLLDLPRLYINVPSHTLDSHHANRFVDALRLSSVLLFKVGYRDTTVSGTFAGIDLKYIVLVEWLLGFYVLACITVTLSKTQPLVNKLIGGLF